LEVHEIFGLELKAEMVTLSACKTALGSGYTERFPKGDDFVGLTRAFIYAGSSSIVASLWEISDPSTAVLMETFYRYFQKMPKAEALALAQRDMITGKILNNSLSRNANYSHPFHWAPFVLVGDWK
jgi:CHAT domain-containing protein